MSNQVLRRESMSGRFDLSPPSPLPSSGSDTESFYEVQLPSQTQKEWNQTLNVQQKHRREKNQPPVLRKDGELAFSHLPDNFPRKNKKPADLLKRRATIDNSLQIPDVKPQRKRRNRQKEIISKTPQPAMVTLEKIEDVRTHTDEIEQQVSDLLKSSKELRKLKEEIIDDEEFKKIFDHNQASNWNFPETTWKVPRWKRYAWWLDNPVRRWPGSRDYPHKPVFMQGYDSLRMMDYGLIDSREHLFEFTKEMHEKYMKPLPPKDKYEILGTRTGIHYKKEKMKPQPVDYSTFCVKSKHPKSSKIPAPPHAPLCDVFQWYHTDEEVKSAVQNFGLQKAQRQAPCEECEKNQLQVDVFKRLQKFEDFILSGKELTSFGVGTTDWEEFPFQFFFHEFQRFWNLNYFMSLKGIEMRQDILQCQKNVGEYLDSLQLYRLVSTMRKEGLY